jgi:hypothetical protein
MYQSIETKFFGPTNFKGTRVQAKACAGTIYHNWDYALSPCENHEAAAKALASKLDWGYSQLVGGGNAASTGYNFVMLCE